jgi:hypothetical protein
VEVGRSIDAGTGAAGSAEILAGESIGVRARGRSRPDGRFAIGGRSARRPTLGEHSALRLRLALDQVALPRPVAFAAGQQQSESQHC